MNERCPCGCPVGMHIGEIGCPCGLPGEPPCAPASVNLSLEERKALSIALKADVVAGLAGGHEAAHLRPAIERIVAARVAAARADAWDEGWQAGHEDAHRGVTRATPNPYRAAVAVPEPEAPNTCPSCALGNHGPGSCQSPLAPCDCADNHHGETK